MDKKDRLVQPAQQQEPINYEEWNYNPMTGKPLWDKQPEPEPVAWMYEYGTDNGDAVNEVRWYKNVSLTQPVLTYNRNVVPLYTNPPQREWQGLTVEEIEAAGKESRKSNLLLPYSFARAIEAKLKEKNGF